MSLKLICALLLLPFPVIYSICLLSLSWHSLPSIESRQRLLFRLTSGCVFHKAETVSILLLGFPFTHPELLELLLKCSSSSPKKTHTQEEFSELHCINKLSIIQAIIFIKSLKGHMKCITFIFLWYFVPLGNSVPYEEHFPSYQAWLPCLPYRNPQSTILIPFISNKLKHIWNFQLEMHLHVCLYAINLYVIKCDII